MMNCSKCGNGLDDNEAIVWKCNSCGKSFRVKLSKLQKLQQQKGMSSEKTFIKCPECDTGLDDGNENLTWKCSKCGYISNENLAKIIGEKYGNSLRESVSDYTGQIQNSNRTKIVSLKSIRNILFVIAILCFIISGVFFDKGYNVKNEYYNSEDFSSLNKNAYVGGDAYNYIINGNYFTGYSVIASAALLSGVILLGSVVNLVIKIKEYE